MTHLPFSFPLLPMLAIVSRIVVCCLFTWFFGGIYSFGRGIFLICMNMGFFCCFIQYLVLCMALYWDLMKTEFYKLADCFVLSHIFSYLAVASIVLWLFCFIL